MTDVRKTDTVWLVVQKRRRGGYGPPIIRFMSKERPALDGDQIAVRVRLAIDMAVFDQPLLDVTLTVDPQQIARPDIIQEAP